MTIYEFQKNAIEKVKIEFSEYMGKKVFSIWVYYLVEGKTDEWKPTKKGMSMDVSHLEELKNGIKLAVERWNDKENDRKSML